MGNNNNNNMNTIEILCYELIILFHHIIIIRWIKINYKRNYDFLILLFNLIYILFIK